MTAPLTAAALDEIEARASAATEGPWVEAWRPIIGRDGYEVSDFGNVRSRFKPGNHKQKRAQVARLLSLAHNTNGYRTVSIPKVGDTVYQHVLVHRLVLESFVGPCPTGHEGAHLNGDRVDNRLVNLQWCTHEENERHKIAHGTRAATENPTPPQRFRDGRFGRFGTLAEKSISQGAIARLFSISHKAVSDVLSRRIWAEEEDRTDVPLLILALRASQAREAELRKYAKHAPRCDSLEHYSVGMLTRGPCDCGLDAAMKETT